MHYVYGKPSVRTSGPRTVSKRDCDVRNPFHPAPILLQRQCRLSCPSPIPRSYGCFTGSGRETMQQKVGGEEMQHPIYF
jgi:hypothetical protein